ncbi:MAG TPA: hypothetical protein VMM81_08375 [Acidimicrobiia bacterium]|nr:hypothetical protein [Acidimicrobiia bacterium]
MRRSLVLIITAALLAAACGAESTTPTTTTTMPVGGVGGQMEELIAATERIRGLEFVEAPVVVILSREALTRRVADLIDEELDPDEVAVWQEIYGVLGLLDRSVDLGDAYRGAYAEQVAGFYDPETGEMFVGADAALTPLDRSIVVHELIHALTDQHFGWWSELDGLTTAGEYDAAAAIHALAEGDATYFQLIYLQSLPIGDYISAVEESLAADTTVLDSLPGWFAADLVFPYDAGFRFVSRLVDSGGVDAVDQAYRLAPSTTEQILQPGKYFISEPALQVVLPPLDLDGYEVFDEGPFGAWGRQNLLLDGISDADRIIATGGWGGDHLRIHWDGSRVAVAFVLEADTPSDATELASALVDAMEARGLGPGRSTDPGVTVFDTGSGYVEVRAGERHVAMVIATEATAGAAVGAALVSVVGEGDDRDVAQ